MSKANSINHKESWLAFEADGWFERNKLIIENYCASEDKVLSLIHDYKLDPSRVLEIGCSAGYRLNEINKKYSNCKTFGIEPSLKAIEYGQQTYPQVEFLHGTADNLDYFESNSLDIVIVGFVFYVVDRNLLFKVVAEIDRVLKNGGFLIIIDFFSETTLKNEYQHIKDFKAYSFKQNYDEIFSASKLYYLFDKSTFNHTNKKLDATIDYYNKFSISLLKKDIDACYK